MLIGSVAEKVLRLSKSPVLVVEEESDVDNFSRILVTTDFSENSKAAFPYAIEIAKKTNAQIELLHVLSFGQLDRDETDDFVEDLREERLKLVKSEYFHEIGDQVTTTLLSTESSPHEAIAEYVKKHPAHVVIMSTVGRTGLNYLMLGSTTANVVRHIPQAVLSVRPS
jgi:nucleotide-binding universal stress UspA family protein